MKKELDCVENQLKPTNNRDFYKEEEKLDWDFQPGHPDQEVVITRFKTHDSLQIEDDAKCAFVELFTFEFPAGVTRARASKICKKCGTQANCRYRKV